MQATSSVSLRIAVWHNLPSGGASRSLNQHIKGLVERGHHIEVWCPPMADQSFLNLGPQVRQHVIPFDHTLPPRFRWKERFRACVLENETLMDRMDEHCRCCAAEINRGNFNVVYLHSCQLFSVPFLGRHIDLPNVLYLHEPARGLYEVWPERLCWEAPEGWRTNGWQKKYWIAFLRDVIATRRLRVRVREERKNVKVYGRLLVNSLFSSEAMQRIYSRGGEVCRLGVDPTLFPFLNLSRSNFVMGLGTIHPHKDLETAILAIASIPHNRPTLVWVGNADFTEYVAKITWLAKQKKVDLEIRKMISQDELVLLLNKARCLLYTSKLEPLGLAPLEANSCGLPVVGVQEGGIRETVLDKYNGLLLPRDPVRLGQAVRRLLADDILFYHLSRNALTHVRDNWGIEQSVDNIEDVLLDMVAVSGNVVHHLQQQAGT